MEKPMATLEHLPKAEAFFRQFIDLHTQNYAEKAQHLSDQYLQHREQFMNKRHMGETKQQVRRMIRLLNHGIDLPEHLRNEVEDLKGLSTQDLLALKAEFEELLEKYDQDSPEELMEAIQSEPNIKKQYLQNNNFSKKKLSAVQEELDQPEMPLLAVPSPNYRGWALLGLESISSLLLFAAIFKFIFID